MKTKLLCTLLTVSLIALLFYAFQQGSRISELEAQLAAHEQQAAPVQAPKSPPEKPLKAQTEPTAPKPIEQAKMQATELANEKPEQTRVIRDLSNMMDNPQMNEMVQASQRATLEVMYKDLLDSYDFSPEEREHFMDLLMARQMFRVETSMKMMGGASEPDEMTLLSTEMKEFDQQVKGEIETFLNNDADVEAFQFFEKTIGERMSLSGFKSTVAEAGKPISAAEERQLLEMMVDQKDAYEFSSDLHDQENYDMGPDRFSPQNIDSFENDLSELHAIIAEEAHSLLDPEQLVALVEALENMRNLQLSQLRMAANMFGPRETDG